MKIRGIVSNEKWIVLLIGALFLALAGCNNQAEEKQEETKQTEENKQNKTRNSQMKKMYLRKQQWLNLMKTLYVCFVT